MSVPNTPRPTGSRPQGTARPQGNAQPQGSARPQGNARPQGSARPQGNAYPQGRRPQAAPVQRFVPQKRPMLPFILICAGALVLGVLLQALLPNGFSLRNGEVGGDGSVATVAEIEASDTVQLNEVMTANGRLFRDASGRTPDWVEVRNASGAPVELQGWTLARSAGEKRIFVFPQRTLAPGECVLVFADSTYEDGAAGYQAPFSLKAAGDTLMLFNPDGVAVEAINIPALAQDAVYRRVDGGWEVSTQFTPGMENTAENYRTMTEAVTPSDVVVNEVMSGNTRTLAAEDGQYYDYIELANLSGTDVDIGGWYLSDDAADSMAWRIPDGTVVPANGFLVFYASGKDGDMHTGFRLSAEGEAAVLTNGRGQIVSIAGYDILDADQAFSRRADGSYTTALAPSPGAANEAY